ncbi:hypothetical protein D9M68_770770 [compost metagenome]
MMLPASPVRIKGPWFIHRDDHPIEGLRDADPNQTTYRGESEVVGAVGGAVLATFAIAYLGNSAGSVPTVPACVLTGVAGALGGWWLGRRLGGLIRRSLIARKRAMLAPGEMLMVVSCAIGTKDSVKLMINELGGESIGERNRVLPDFHWA